MKRLTMLLVLCVVVGCGETEGKGEPAEVECPEEWTVADACNALQAENRLWCHACNYSYDRCISDSGFSYPGRWWAMSGGDLDLGFGVCSSEEECERACEAIDPLPAQCFERSDCPE